MALDRTWAQSLNNSFTPGSGTIESNWEAWALGAALCGNSNMGSLVSGLWTVEQSSNSLVADATDNLHLTGVGAFTTGDWVHAVNTVAHSWYVLKSPTIAGGNFRMFVSMNTATVTQITIQFARSAYTGGSATTDPTSPNSWIATATAPVAINAGSTNAHRANILLSSTGDFWFFIIRAGQFGAELLITFQNPVGCDANDPYPGVGWARFLNVGASSTGVGGFGNIDLCTNGINCRVASGEVGLGFIYATQQARPTATYDAITGFQLDNPCWFIASISSGGGWHHRGRLPDCVQHGTNGSNVATANGDIIQNVGVTVGVSMGTFIIPLTAAPDLT